MAKKQTFTVVGPFEVHGAKPGETFTADPGDDGIRLNLAAGVIAAAKPPTTAAPTKVACPACAEHMKRPPRFSTQEELATHYGEKHPALAAPTWGGGS